MFIIVWKYLIPKGFHGITLFPFIFLNDSKLKQDSVVITHEKIHLQQQLELLVLPFFIWYVLEFVYRLLIHRNRKTAYYAISFEREAYHNEKDLNYLEKRTVWSFLKYF
jgi:hypothetical protein